MGKFCPRQKGLLRLAPVPTKNPVCAAERPVAGASSAGAPSFPVLGPMVAVLLILGEIGCRRQRLRTAEVPGVQSSGSGGAAVAGDAAMPLRGPRSRAHKKNGLTLHRSVEGSARMHLARTSAAFRMERIAVVGVGRVSHAVTDTSSGPFFDGARFAWAPRFRRLAPGPQPVRALDITLPGRSRWMA